MHRVLMAGYAGSVHFFRWAGYVREAGFSVDVLSYEKPTKIDPTLSYEAYTVVPRPSTRLAKLLFVLHDILKVNDPSYVLANFHYLAPRWAFYMLLRHGPSLLTCWGSDILVHYRHARGLGKALLRGALRKAAAITCDSEDVRRIIVESTGQPEKVHLVYWGVDTRRFSVTPEARAAARFRHGISPESTVILSIRRATSHFQLEEVIEWFEGTIRDPSVVLFLHAVPEMDPQYAARCMRRAAGVRNIILNTKKLTPDELIDLYALSDIDIHNPVTDATPVSMLEGIACRNLVLCREGIEAYRDLGRRYTLEFFRSLDEVTEERIRRMRATKEQVTGKNLSVLVDSHSEATSVAALRAILRSLITGEQAGGEGTRS